MFRALKKKYITKIFSYMDKNYIDKNIYYIKARCFMLFFIFKNLKNVQNT